MELRQLEYFQMVCQLRSISKAAEHLYVAQPSVSIAIQKLEEELGVQLLDRTQRQITLTAEGLRFFHRVNDILVSVKDSVNEMRDLRSSPIGSVKIGIPPMIGMFLFPPIFAQFRKQYPQIELVAVEGGSLSIQSLIEQGRIDIGIITQSQPSSLLKTLLITSGQIHACLPIGHPLSNLPSIPFHQFRDQPFILLKEDTYNRQVVMEECKKHHFTPQIVFSSSQVETIINLIELEIGISFLFDRIAKKYSTIRSCPLVDPIHFQIVLAWNRNRYLTNASRAFIDFITGIHLSL